MFLRDVSSNVDVAPRGAKASSTAGLEPLVGTNHSTSIRQPLHEGESVHGKGGASAMRSGGGTTTTTSHPVSFSSSSTRYPQGTPTLYPNRNTSFSRLSVNNGDGTGSAGMTGGDIFGGKSASSFPLPSNYFSGAHSHSLSTMNANPPPLPHTHSHSLLSSSSSTTTGGMNGGPTGMERRSATTDHTGGPPFSSSSSASAAGSMGATYAAPRGWRLRPGGTLSPSAMNATGGYEKKHSDEMVGGRPTSVPLPSSMLEGGGSRGGSGGGGSVFSPMEMGREKGKAGAGGSGMAPPPLPVPASKGHLPPSGSHGTSSYDAYESVGGKRNNGRETRGMMVASGPSKTALWTGKNQSSTSSHGGTSYLKNTLSTNPTHTMLHTLGSRCISEGGEGGAGAAEPAPHASLQTTTPAEYPSSHLHPRTFTASPTGPAHAPSSTTSETQEKMDSRMRSVRVEARGSYPPPTSTPSSSAIADAAYLSRAKAVPSSSATTTMASSTATTTTTTHSSSFSFSSSSVGSTDSSSSPQISYGMRGNGGGGGGTHALTSTANGKASTTTAATTMHSGSLSLPLTGVSLDRYLRTIPYCPRLIDDITKTFLQRERAAVREFTEGMAPHNSHRSLMSSELSDLHRYYAAPHYLQFHPDITPRMRVIVVDWVLGVHKVFRHYRETLFLCINIFDRYLSVVNTKYKPFRGMTRSKLQLVAVSAYFIAMKYEELVTVELKDLVSVSANLYTKEEIMETEMKICTALGFRFVVPTSYQFSMRLLIVLEGSYLIREAEKPHRCMEQLFHLTNFFLEHALLDYNALQFTPSQVGNAAVFLAIHTLQHNMWLQKERRTLENPAASSPFSTQGPRTSASATSGAWGSSVANGEGGGHPSHAARNHREGTGVGGEDGGGGGSVEREEERGSVGGGVPRGCLDERDPNQHHCSSYKRSEEEEMMDAGYPGSPMGRQNNSNQRSERGGGGGATTPSRSSLNSSALSTHSSPVWTTALEQVSESSAEEFLCCSEGMLNYVETIRSSKYQIVRDKYTSSRFGEVCKLVMPPCLPPQ